MDISSLNKGQRAAVLLIALGEEAAPAVIAQMDPGEIERVGAYMAQMQHVTPDVIDQVLVEFFDLLGQKLNSP